LIRHCFFTAGVYEEGAYVSKEYLPQNIDYVADQSAHLFVDLPATKAFLAAFRQTNPSHIKSA